MRTGKIAYPNGKWRETLPGMRLSTERMFLKAGWLESALLEDNVVTFLDTDATLETATQRTIADIFAEDGEEEFRKLEGSIMEQVAAYVRLVVATGGGVVSRQQNWASLRQGIVVWIDPPLETLVQRLENSAEEGKRPLLKDDAAATLKATLEKRRDLYAQCDVRITLDGDENPSAVAERVVKDALAFIRANPPKAAPEPPQ